MHKGATSGEAKGAEAPPLAKQKDKVSDSFNLFVSQWSEVAWFGQFMSLKIDYDTLKRHFHNVIKITTPKICHQNDATIFFFHFQAPTLAKF